MGGKLFGFDGGDGSGKQTQSEMLQKALVARGHSIVVMSFPRYKDTRSGRWLRDALDGKYGDFLRWPPELASVPYAMDRLESKEEILAALQAGKHVLLDRYVSANLIHQGGKFRDGDKRQRFIFQQASFEYRLLGLPRPDVMIYLDVPPEVSIELMRGRGGLDVAERNEGHILDSYRAAHRLIQSFPDEWLHIRCTKNGAMRSREDIHEEVLRRLVTRLDL